MAAVDWSPLERAGGDAAAAVPLFQALAQHANDPMAYTHDFQQLTALLADKPAARRAAAAAAEATLPFLYGQVAAAQMPGNRSLPLLVVAVLALGRPQDFVPHGVTADTATPDIRETHARVAPTVVARVLPLLADREMAVRSNAAFLLSFFPAEVHAADAAGDAAVTTALLDMVENEQCAEPRLSAMVALAMLQRAGAPTVASDGADRAARTAFVDDRLAPRCARVLGYGAGHTEADAAAYGLALARAVLGVHALADIELLLRTATRMWRPHLRELPRSPDRLGESKLPFAAPYPPALPPPIAPPEVRTAPPPLASLSLRVLAHLPGPGPEPTKIVFALGAAVPDTPPDELHLLVQALLRSACGVRPDGSGAVPTPWPAHRALDDRMGAAVRAIARHDAQQHVYSLREAVANTLLISPVLREWHLPQTYRGLQKYLVGVSPAEDPKIDKSGCCCVQ